MVQRVFKRRSRGSEHIFSKCNFRTQCCLKPQDREFSFFISIKHYPWMILRRPSNKTITIMPVGWRTEIICFFIFCIDRNTHWNEGVKLNIDNYTSVDNDQRIEQFNYDVRKHWSHCRLYTLYFCIYLFSIRSFTNRENDY